MSKVNHIINETKRLVAEQELNTNELQELSREFIKKERNNETNIS